MASWVPSSPHLGIWLNLLELNVNLMSPLSLFSVVLRTAGKSGALFPALTFLYAPGLESVD